MRIREKLYISVELKLSKWKYYIAIPMRNRERIQKNNQYYLNVD